MSEIKGEYPKSEQGNFEVMDTIGVPHPYCITPKHLKYCDSMYLNADTIKHAEERGAKCDICRKLVSKGKQSAVLSYDEHEQALVVLCHAEMQDSEGKAIPELHQWLLSIKEEATANGYAGFAFKRAN